MKIYRYLLLVLPVAVLISAGTPASADTIQSFQGSFGTGKTGQATSLDLTQQTTDTAGSKPMRADRATWLLPDGAVIEIRSATFCSQKKLESTGACPAGSKIGSGKVKMDVRVGSFNQVEGDVVAYNAEPAKPGKGQVGRLLLQINDPASGNKAVLVGRITKGESPSPYGYSIKFDTLPSPPFDQSTQVVYTNLNVSLKAKKRKRTKTKGVVTYNYITTPPSCNSSNWYFQGLFRMENKVLLKAQNSFACSR